MKTIVNRTPILKVAAVFFLLASAATLLYAQNAIDQEFVKKVDHILQLENSEANKELDALPEGKLSLLVANGARRELNRDNGVKLALYLVANDRFSEKTRINALRTLTQYILETRSLGTSTNPTLPDCAEMTSAIKLLSDAYPQSIDVAKEVVDAFNAYLRQTKILEGYALTATNSEIIRAQKIRSLVPVLQTLRKRYRDERRWDVNYAIDAGSTAFFLYRELIAAFARNNSEAWIAPQGFYADAPRYASVSLDSRTTQTTIVNYLRRQTLSPTNGEVATNDVKLNRNFIAPTLQYALVDENGEPIFYKTPDSFESAQNDGERVCALRKELFEFGSNLVKADVLTEEALEASAIFGLDNILNTTGVPTFQISFRTISPPALSDDDIRSLADDETFILLTSGPKRIKLPQEYAYQDLWRQAHEYALTHSRNLIETEIKKNSNYNPVISLNQNVKTLASLTRVAVVKEALLRQNIERVREIDSVYGAFCQKYKLGDASSFNSQLPSQFLTPQQSLAQILTPNVAIYKAPFVSGFANSELTLVYRNADAAEIVARRIEFAPNVTVETFLNKLQKNPFTTVSTLKSILYRQLTGNVIDPSVQDVEYFQFQNAKTYSVVFDGDVKSVDQTMTFKVNDLAPGAYLLEATAKKDGEIGGTDRAILWIHDLAVLRFDNREGASFCVFDAQTGAPLSNVELDVYSLEYPQPRPAFVNDSTQSNAREQKRDEAKQASNESVVKQTITTNEEGVAFLTIAPKGEGNAVRIFVAARRQGDDRFNLASVVDVLGVGSSNASTPRSDGMGYFFTTDRPLYQEGETAFFKCWIHPNLLKELDKREVSYCVYDSFGKSVVEKSGIPLDRFGAFSDSFVIPVDESSRRPFFSQFVVDIGDEFSNDNQSEKFARSSEDYVAKSAGIGDRTPRNARRFKRCLAGGTICAEHIDLEQLLKINVEPLSESVKLGEPLSVKISVAQNNGEPVQEGTVQCQLEATPKPPQSGDDALKAWDWYYSQRPSAPFNPEKRTIATDDANLDANGRLETAFSTSLDALFYPTGARTYALSITARTPDGKFGKIRQDFTPETKEVEPPPARVSPFTFQVEPSVVFPGQTATVRVQGPRDGKALARVVDRYGYDLRKPEILTFKDGKLETTIDVDERMVSFFEVEIYSVASGQLDCAKVSIYVPPKDRFLTLTLDYDQSQVQPGAKIKARLLPPTDGDGAPIDVSVFAAGYDATLDVAPITEKYRDDPRKTMTKTDVVRIGNVLTNLASSITPILSANKMSLMPAFHSPDSRAFVLLETSDFARLFNANTATYGASGYDGNFVKQSAPIQMGGVDYLQTSPNCSKYEFVLEAGQDAEFEVAIPADGADAIVEVVAVDEQGRVGFLRERIATKETVDHVNKEAQK